MHIDYYIYIFIIFLSFLSGLKYFRPDSPKYLKTLCLLLGLTLLVELFGFWGVRLFHLKTNQWLYNGFSLVEFCTYAYIFRLVVYIKRYKKFNSYFLIIFPFAWIFNFLFVSSISILSSYLEIAGSIFLVVSSLALYRQLITHQNLNPLKKTPEFWFATGILIFYTCQIPYIGLLNYLVKNFPNVAMAMNYILFVLNIVLYSMFALSFLCHPTNKKS